MDHGLTVRVVDIGSPFSSCCYRASRVVLIDALASQLEPLLCRVSSLEQVPQVLSHGRGNLQRSYESTVSSAVVKCHRSHLFDDVVVYCE
jgi:hypothetical protein